MSNKINIDDVIGVLKSTQIEDNKIHVILKELRSIIEEEKNDKEENKVPKPKGKFVVCIRSDNASLQKELTQGAYIIQVSEENDTSNLLQRIQTAARSHNDSLKRAKTRVSSFGDAMNFIKRKFSKTGEYMVKTKLPVEVQVITEEKIV